jgi:AraC family transcriptional regulator, arabinose operon regulatory protein
MEETRRVHYSQTTAQQEIRLLLAGRMIGGNGFGDRSYHLLHYVTDGRGSVTNQHLDQQLSAGDLFIIRPQQELTYRADDKAPWSYFWMGFDGPWADELTNILAADSNTPFFMADFDPIISSHFKMMLDSLETNSASGLLQSEAWMRLILSRLLTNLNKDTTLHRSSPPRMVIRHSQEFMITHCSEPITVNDVCVSSGYERTYFSDLFKRETGQTIQEYLSGLRINKATKLLSTTELSVDSIAKKVGYFDYRSFSRRFKNFMKVSPKEFRQKILNTDKFST